MRYALIKFTLLFVAIPFGFSAAEAQITIKIPNIKKITKPNIKTDTTSNVSDNDTTATPKTDGSGSTNWWVDYQIGEINKYKQRLSDWDPAKQYFPNPQSNDDYIGLAFSKKERAAWLRDKKVEPDTRLDAALDELKDVLTRRLPEYKINQKSFLNRNAAEEKLVLAALPDVPGIKIFKIGFNQASWLIDKNELGIPKARYKHGLVYGRDPASEDPFCRVWYVNVVQDYAGGGTYGATEARYIERSFIACPAQ